MTSLISGLLPVLKEPADVIVAFPCLFDQRSDGWLGTTNHLGLPSTVAMIFESKRPTVWPISVESASSFIADEVLRLRDQIVQTAGLTRQEIAFAIGVDRRSLSGFVSGEIKPTPSRVDSLRLLARVAQFTARRWGERTREVLLAGQGGRSPLELVAAGDMAVFGLLESIDVADAAVTVRERVTKPAPLYVAARSFGEQSVPRLGVVRSAADYEQELAEAFEFDEPQASSRRRNIR